MDEEGSSTSGLWGTQDQPVFPLSDNHSGAAEHTPDPTEHVTGLLACILAESGGWLNLSVGGF